MKKSQLSNRFDRLLQSLGLGSNLRAVLLGAGLVMLIQIGSAAVSYTSQVLLARWMGVLEFGIYAFAWSWAQPISVIAGIGLSAAAIRFVPQYRVEEDWGRLHGLIRRSRLLVLGIGTLVALLGWFILGFVDEYLDAYYIFPTRLVLLAVPFLALILLTSGVARGFGRAGLAYVPQMLVVPGSLVIAVGIFKLVVGTPTAADALGLAVCVCVLTALGHQWLFQRTLPREVNSARPILAISTWLRVALPLFLADGVFLVLWNVDIVMLGSLMTPEDVAVYHASVKTAALSYLAFTAVRSLAAPKFAEIFASEGQRAQQKFVTQIARWTLWPTILVIVVLCVGGRWILSTFGETFVVGYPALLVLILGYLSRAMTGPLSAYLSVSGHQNDVLYANASAALANVALNLVLIPRYGIMGAAASSVLALLLSQIWLYVTIRRRLGIHPFFLARA